MRLRLLTLAATLATVLCVSASSPAEGWWKGMLMQRLPLVIHITASPSDPQQLAAMVYSPMQTADSFPAARVEFADSLLTLSLPALNASFSGRLTEGPAIDGTFTQGMQLPLRLTPGSPDDILPARPQTPQPPFFYLTEDITFLTPDSITIGGTIAAPFTRPAGALVLVSGSGAQNRDEEIYRHKPFAVIADYLARMGWATLRCDDRGVGSTSPGRPDDTTITYAGDAMAAVGELRRRFPGIPVGILGHSEGGTIALYNAARHPDEIDLAISLAGMAINGRDLMIRQNEMLAEHAGQPQSPESHALMVKVFDAIREPGTPAQVAARIDSLYACIEPDSTRRAPTVAAMSTPWYIGFIRLDPSQWLADIKAPVLAIAGSWDLQVEAEPNLRAIADALPQARTELLPDLNHMLQESPSRQQSFGYATITQTISPLALRTIASFLTDFTRSRK